MVWKTPNNNCRINKNRSPLNNIKTIEAPMQINENKYKTILNHHANLNSL